MFAHFRPNEFLHIKFDVKELVVGYNALRHLYKNHPTPDLAKMIQAMEDKLFPKPKLVLVTNYHLCSLCCQEIDTNIDRYQMNTNSNGFINWRHAQCPPLREDRP